MISHLLYKIRSLSVNIKGRRRRLRLKAHILDDPLGNPYDGLKVLFGPPYGPYKDPLWPYKTPKIAVLASLSPSSKL